jgi:ATP-dependent DNA helicase DinG
MLYAPLGMPDPNAWNYTDAVVDAAWPAVKAANGGAFFLCTSLRAMRRTHELLKAKLEEENIDMPLLVQGEGSKNDLLQRFRHHGRPILVGSQSFWEASMCAARPCHWSSSTRSLRAARRPGALGAHRADEAEGRNAFMEYQLPRAVINVKQGAGRLIRDENDKGVLMICDPRLISKPYGRRSGRACRR